MSCFAVCCVDDGAHDEYPSKPPVQIRGDEKERDAIRQFDAAATHHRAPEPSATSRAPTRSIPASRAPAQFIRQQSIQRLMKNYDSGFHPVPAVRLPHPATPKNQVTRYLSDQVHVQRCSTQQAPILEFMIESNVVVSN